MPVAAGSRPLLRSAQPGQALRRSRLEDGRTGGTRSRSSSPPRTSSSTTHPRHARRLFGLAWDELHALHPALVVGVVTSFGPHGPLAGRPPTTSSLRGARASSPRTPLAATACRCARAGSRWPISRRVICSRPGSRSSRAGADGGGEGQLVEVSLLGAALAVQIQDLVWLEGEADGPAKAATRTDLAARADEIAGGLAMNPYYRCYEAADGFLAVACLNLAAAGGVSRVVRSSRTRRSRLPISCRTTHTCSRRSSV